MHDNSDEDYGWKAAATFSRWAWFFLVAGILGAIVFNFSVPVTSGSVSIIIGAGVLVGLILNGCFFFSILRAVASMAAGIARTQTKLDSIERRIPKIAEHK